MLPTLQHFELITVPVNPNTSSMLTLDSRRRNAQHPMFDIQCLMLDAPGTGHLAPDIWNELHGYGYSCNVLVTGVTGSGAVLDPYPRFAGM